MKMKILNEANENPQNGTKEQIANRQRSSYLKLPQITNIHIHIHIHIYMTDSNKRTKPNILITGTPCVGKTATASLIAERLNMYHVNVGDIISKNKCHLENEYDDTLQSHVLDEDKLLDILEVTFDGAGNGNGNSDDDGDDSDSDDSDDDNAGNNAKGGIKGNLIADYHACDLFPERWFDLILVLRCQTHTLYDRYVGRNYNERKRTQNMECEIMNVILDEARDSYDGNIVVELQSNTVEDMESNVERVMQWYRQWILDHGSGNGNGNGNGTETDENITMSSSWQGVNVHNGA